ncbi:bifunctional DNA-formamidopyrimidine glycosylase/DNA-(apurinic or apyrimidinic site) lyase [bacterium]|nr:bifunctional DNA-formamidopyrimidine glycosylase/DNA-(apurinic or apyrimidinic site) lyase [bacterium]
MPELPEVETIARQIAPVLSGRRVKAIEIFDPLLKFAPPAGRFRIGEVRRIGKEAGVELIAARRPPLWLLFHLRMTGNLIWSANHGAPPVPPARARIVLEGGALEFRDVRRLGTMRLVEGTVPEPGIDPTGPRFTAGRLAALLEGSHAPIKPWLMRQDRLAGIGNIYASEALFEARIDPRRQAGGLTRDEIARLRRAIGLILRRAIRACGTTINDYRDSRGSHGTFASRLAVYGRKGEPCPRCATPVERVVQQQRSTYFCPHCQK